MNIDIHDKDFQEFVINNIPVFMLETMMTMYQADLGIERAMKIDKGTKLFPISDGELKEFIKNIGRL